MRLYARNEFTWVRNSLWFKDDYLLALVPDEKHPEMFWIKFNDETQSDDYYNLTRAREHAIELVLEEFNIQVFDSISKGQEIGLEARGEV